MDQSPRHRWGVSKVAKTVRGFLLGKSDPGYLRRLTGSDAYWDAMNLVQRDQPAHVSSDPEIEPVFGLPRQEVEAWLTSNPNYRPFYDSELDKHKIYRKKT